MARVHATTQFSPNELVYAKKLKLPAPVGDLHWDASEPAVASLGAYVGERDARFDGFCAAAYDRILRSQRASMDRARVAAARRPGGEKPLQVGDLAYLLRPLGRTNKRQALGSFVVLACALLRRCAGRKLSISPRIRTTWHGVTPSPTQLKSCSRMLARPFRSAGKQTSWQSSAHREVGGASLSLQHIVL